jgi:putative membrane protein
VKLLLRLLLVMGAFYAVGALVPGVSLSGDPADLLVIALLFGVLNLLVKPVLTVLSLPFVVLTLGLFLVVVNAAVLALTAALTSRLDVDGVGAALVGALVLSVVTFVGERALGLEE